MRIISKSVLLVSAIALAACGGGGKLSFKNADTVIKSYGDVTADMTELERQTFSRYLMLIVEDNDTAPADLKFSDWNAAVSAGRDLKYLTPDNELAKDYASELALKGASSLDGKSVGFVLKRGEDIKASVMDAEVKEIEKTLADLDGVTAQLAKDKAKLLTDYKAALAAEQALLAKMAIYKPAYINLKEGKDWSGKKNITGDLRLYNPHPDKINDFRAELHVKYKGYTARYNNPMLLSPGREGKPGQTGQSPYTIAPRPQDFRSDATGMPPDKAFTLPANYADYAFAPRPIWVRTSGKTNGWKEYENKLTKAQSEDIYNVATYSARCDQSAKIVQDLKASYKDRIATIRAGKLEDLKSIWGQYSKSCAAR